MKKLFTLMLFFVAFSMVHAQDTVWLDESFGQGIPNNWKVIDNDNELTDSTALSALFGQPAQMQGVGWGPFAITSQGQTRRSAWSTSKHINTAAPADDWLISPAITIDSFTQVAWDAASFNTPLSAYEVRISTTTDSISQFLLNPAIYTSAGETANNGLQYTTRSVMLRQINAAYANTTIYLAFRNMGTDDFVLVVDDVEVSNWIGSDLSLTTLRVPQSTCSYSGTDQISVNVNNEGLQSWSNVDLVLVVDTGGGTITVNETVPGPIDSGATVTHTFVPTFNFNKPTQVFNVQVYLNETGDNNNDNDTVTGTVTDVEPSAIPYTTNLDNATTRLGWITQDVNQDAGDWSIFNGAGRANSNSYGYIAFDNVTGDDWLFSTCLTLDDAKAYTLDFWERVGNFGPNLGFGLFPTPEDLEVWIGTSPNAASMTTRLLDLPNLFDTTAYVKQTVDFTVTADATYYIGFHAQSDANLLDFVLVDDVSITEVPPPTAGFTYTTNDLDISLTNTSTGYIDSVSIDMGDGTILTGFPTPHSYADTGTYTICLTVFNPSGSDQVCQTVQITTTSIALIPGARLDLFPNPAKDKLIMDVQFDELEDVSFELVDLTGRTIIREVFGATDRERKVFDVSRQAPGIYLATFDVNGIKQTKKVVITQ